MTTARRNGEAAERLDELVRDEAAHLGLEGAQSRIAELVSSGRLRKVGGDENPYMVDRRDFLRHSGVIDMIGRRIASWDNKVNHAVLDAVLAAMAFVPDPLQRRAIETAVENPLTIVHGGPGTGKSTIIKAIGRYLDAVEDERTQVVTALAAKIAMTTGAKAGIEALTLHSLTGSKPGEEDLTAGAIDPDIGTIYVDEAFAVPPGILHRLLRQAPSETRIVFAGDPAQLPPIGQGRILHDVLLASLVPSVALRTSHRLGADAHLAREAASVADGHAPKAGPGLEILTSPKGRRRDVDRAKANCAIDTRRRRGEDGRRIGILTMTRHGECGHEAISRRIAGAETPGVGHDVITTRRHPEGKWRNGQSGRVTASIDGMIEITFETGAPVWTNEADQGIAFAYAMSVHRAQGLEYDECILVLTRSDIRVLSRQALVSAMTRARHCIVVTDEGVLERAVMKDEIAQRAPITGTVIARRTRP